MIDKLNAVEYSKLITTVTTQITQEHVDKFAEVIYSLAESVMLGECSVETDLQELLDSVTVPKHFDKEHLMSQIVGVFIGLELAKQGGKGG